MRKVNGFRQEVGLPPCQPKNILFMYCTPTKEAAKKAEGYLAAANRDVVFAYGLNDPANFAGVKGYETYAARVGSATAAASAEELRRSLVSSAAAGSESKKMPSYDQSNFIIGTPDQILERIEAGQKACSFSEITLAPQFGDMPYEEASRSVKLFAQEVLPAVHKMDAPMHASALPAPQQSAR